MNQTNNDFKKPLFPFGLVSMKKYLSRMNFEILILHFNNKNCFDVSLKQFAFEILQLFGNFLENG
jgi:hypothetical protein